MNSKFLAFALTALTILAGCAAMPKTPGRITRELTPQEAREVPKCKCACRQLVIEEDGKKWLMTSPAIGCGDGTIWPWPKPGESW